jgi:hypothetical protein
MQNRLHQTPRGLAGAAGALLFFFSVPGVGRAQGVDVGLPEHSLDLQFHGFVSQGFLITTDNDYLAHSERGSFEFSEVGFNATVQLTDRLRAGMQLFARDLGPIGDYKPTMDWFYLDYRWKDWLGLRTGRVKVPLGLYNDINDIDAARTPILLPQSVYPIESRDFLLAQTGAELYGYLDLGEPGAIDYRVFGGTIFLDVPDRPTSPIVVTDLSIPYVFGGRLLWETPLEGLRTGASVEALKLETELVTPPEPATISVDLPAVLWVASVEYQKQDLQIAAEYGRWHVDVESSDPMVVPERTTVSERGYGMIAYRFSSWLKPSAYYSILYPDTEDRSGRASEQHDAALTARFDLNLFWILKLEGHFMRGTAALSESLNDGRTREELTRNWLVLLAKTTAYF